MEQFGDKVAVITGGASGIGLATARRLTREGMKLVLADIQPEPLARAESEIRALGVEALGVQTAGARELHRSSGSEMWLSVSMILRLRIEASTSADDAGWVIWGSPF